MGETNRSEGGTEGTLVVVVAADWEEVEEPAVAEVEEGARR